MSRDQMNWDAPRNVQRCAEVEFLLRQGPMTMAQLREHTDLSRYVVAAILWHMRSKIHVSEWLKSQVGTCRALYCWGAGEDAPRPNVYRPDNLRAKLSREERKAELIARSAKYKDQPVRRDWVAVAMFGEARA